MVSSERGERLKVFGFSENVYEKNNTLHVFDTNDETTNNFPDEVSELPIPGTHLEQQSHPHHMVSGQTAQTNQVPDFLTRRVLIPREQSSQQHQNLSAQVSLHNHLPMVEPTPRNQIQTQTILSIVYLKPLQELQPSNDHKQLQC